MFGHSLTAVTPEISMMIRETDNWILRVFAGTLPKRIILCGNTGSGKTHTLNAARRYIGKHAIRLWKARAYPVRISQLSWMRVAALDQEEFSRCLQDEASGCDVLFLDDIGAETDQFKSGAPSYRLQRLLDLNKHVMAATNIRPDNWPEKWNARVASRLADGVIVELWETPDYRGTRTVIAKLSE